MWDEYRVERYGFQWCVKNTDDIVIATGSITFCTSVGNIANAAFSAGWYKGSVKAIDNYSKELREKLL